MGQILNYETPKVRVPDTAGMAPATAQAPYGQWHVGQAIGTATSELAQGLKGVGDAFQRSQDEEARAWAAGSVSKAHLDWSQQLLDRQSAAEPNAPNFTPNFLRDFEAYSNNVIGKAPTEASKKYITEKLAALHTTLGGQAMAFESKARLEYRENQFMMAIDNRQKLMNTDPSQYQQAVNDSLDEIKQSNMPPMLKDKLTKKARDGISEAAVWSQIQKDSAAFLTSIGFMTVPGKTRKGSGDLAGVTGNAAFDALPFDKRTQMFEIAVRTKAQVDADAERATTLEGKRVSDETAKNLWSGFFSKKGRAADVEAMRPVLHPGEYVSLMKAYEKPEGGPRTDPRTLNQLETMFKQGRYDEAEKFALTQQQNGNLSNADMTSAVTRARTLGRQEGPKSSYERGREYINKALAPSPLIHDPIAQQRAADAYSAFDSWMTLGKHTDDEIDARSKEITHQYQLINLQDTLLALPQPRTATQIPRSGGDPKASAAAIFRAGKELDDKFARKLLSDQEYQQEMASLNRWRKAIEAIPPPPKVK